MAQQNRTTLKALIDSYITTNGNKDITGAQLNEVLTNLNDSAFLQLDELRTALSTSYNPATPSDWNVVPTQLKGSTDELAARMRVFETNNFSQDFAFVSNDGDDLTAELGAPSKPFATIQAGINAVSSGGTVKVLGGTYTENLSIVKDNFVLDAQGIILNGAITFDGDSVIMNFKGSNINSSVLGYGIRQISSTNKYCQIIGGVWTESLAANSEAFQNLNGTKIKDCFIFNTGYCIRGCNDCFFDNVVADGVAGINVSANNVFNNCKIETTATFAKASAYTSPNSANSNKFINCHLISVIPLNSESTAGFNGEFINTKIENVGSGNAIVISGSTFLLTFTNNCILIGQSNCVELTTVTRPTGTDVLFKDCILYAGTGEIIKEPTYSGSDLGETLCINNTFNKTQLTSVKVTEQNTYVNTNLQQF